MFGGELPLLGSLLSLSSGALPFLSEIGKGVTGNVAHDFLKLTYKSLATRATSGQLARNHDLVRACRRARLMATMFTARQFAHDQRDTGAARWAEQLALDCWKEGRETLNDRYEVPPSTFDGRLDLLLSTIEGSELPAADLQSFALAELRAEIDNWHVKRWKARDDGRERPPSAFLDRLTSKWPYQELADPWHLRFIRTLAFWSKPPKSRFVLGEPPNGNVRETTWFAVFAASFAEELKTQHRVEVIFTQQLLADIHARVGQGGSEPPTAQTIREALSQGLEPWGRQVCSQMAHFHEALMDALRSGHDALLQELARAESRDARTNIVLRAIRKDTKQTLVHVVEIKEKLEALAAGVPKPQFQLSERPPTLVTPSPQDSPPWSMLDRIQALRIVDPLQGASYFQQRRELHEVVQWLRSAREGVLAICGIGGAGKTALVQHMQRLVEVELLGPGSGELRFGIAKLFVFTFYKPGTSPATLHDQLVHWLAGGDVEGRKFELLVLLQTVGVEAMRRGQKLLLVVDGLEEVQQRSNPDAALGSIDSNRDPWLRSLLCAAAQGALPGVLVVVTSRLGLADLEELEPRHYRSLGLGGLESKSALALLQALGVSGDDASLSELVKGYAGHALSLSLLGRLIAYFHRGDVHAFRRWEQELTGGVVAHASELSVESISPMESRRIKRIGERLGRVAGFYSRQFQRSDAATLGILRCIAVFRLPADARRFTALFTGASAVPIVGPELAALDESHVALRLKRLVDLGLVSSGAEGDYTMHPGIRAAMRTILDDEQERGIERAIVGQLHVELEDRATEPVFDARRIEAIRAFVLHLLAADPAAAAALETGKSALQIAWRWLIDPPPYGLGGWEEVVWGRYPVSNAVIAICEALEHKLGAVPGTHDAHAFERRRAWSAALRETGQLERAAELLKKMKERIEIATEQSSLAQICNDLREVCQRQGYLSRALFEARADVAHAAPRWQPLTGLEVARLEIDHGLFEQAISSCTAAVRAACARGGRELLENHGFDYRLAACLIDLGAPHEAAELARHAVGVLGRRSSGSIERGVATGRQIEARALLALGDTERSLQAIEEAERIHEARRTTGVMDTREQHCHALIRHYARSARAGKPPEMTQLSSVRQDLLHLIRASRNNGLGALHSRCLLTMAEVDLVLGQLTTALYAAETALYGQQQGTEGTGSRLYEAPSLNELTAKPIDLDPAQSARLDVRGIFPPIGSAWPELPALTHSLCDCKPEQARAHLVVAKALLLAAETAPLQPEMAQARIRRAEYHVKTTLELRALYTKGTNGGRDPLRQQAERILADLAHGILSHAHMAWPPVPEPDSTTAKATPRVATAQGAELQRRYRCSVSFPRSRSVFAEGVARALAEYFGREQVFYEPFHPHVAAEPCAEMLKPKRYIYDSTMIVVIEAEQVEPNDAWTGFSSAEVLALAPWTDHRIVIVGSRLESTRRNTEEPGAEIERVAGTAVNDLLTRRLVRSYQRIGSADCLRNAYYLKFTPKEGRHAYYFVEVSPAQEKAFLVALKGTEKFDLEDFGTIIQSGYGDPSRDLRRRMTARYGITYDDDNDPDREGD